MARIKCGNCHATHTTVEEVRNCYTVTSHPGRMPTVSDWAAKKHPQRGALVEGNMVYGIPPKRDSIYTIVFDGVRDDRITVRFYTPRQGKFRDVTLVKYLHGPDNNNDYTGFGQVTTDGVKIWYRYRENKRLKDAVSVLLSQDEKVLEEFGKAYAMQSGNCYVCGRTLTEPTSIELGIGPICRGA